MSLDKKVSDFMSQEVITLAEKTPIAEAFDLLGKNDIRHLPIVDENKSLVGILSSRDLTNLRLALDIYETLDESYQGPETLTLKDLMQAPVHTINEGAAMADAAEMMIAKKVGALPVLSPKGNLSGIISYEDILGSLVKG